MSGFLPSLLVSGPLVEIEELDLLRLLIIKPHHPKSEDIKQLLTPGVCDLVCCYIVKQVILFFAPIRTYQIAGVDNVFTFGCSQQGLAHFVLPCSILLVVVLLLTLPFGLTRTSGRDPRGLALFVCPVVLPSWPSSACFH